MKTFVLSDESLNSQGFRVMTEGIVLDQFKKNPVMLFSHNMDMLPIGVWENIRVEDGKLLADAVFDQEDEEAKKIEKKVENGIIKCCSIGFRVLEWSEDPELLLPGQKYDTVTKAELIECSICAVGANRNAMALYDSNGEKIEITEEKMLSLGFKKIDKPLQSGSVNKISKNMAEKEIKELQEERDNLQKQLEEQSRELQQLRETAAANHQANIEALLSAAVEDGRIAASAKDKWKKLMDADFEGARDVLADLQKRVSLSEMMKPGQKGGSYTGKTWDELDKEGKLMEYKDADFEGFKNMYKNKFGVEYKE